MRHYKGKGKQEKAIPKSSVVIPNSEPAKKWDFGHKLLLICYVLIISITFYKVYDHIFDKKVHLGGDNADYYILGNAIANGEGYTNIHFADKNSHTHFPPGYPVIMSVVIKLFSNDTLTLKFANGFFLWLSVLVLFYLFYRFSENLHMAFVISIFTILNSHLLQYSTIMMSEVPFLFFTSLSLLLFIKTKFDKPFYKNPLFFVLLISLSVSYHIRTTGVAIIAGMMLVLVLKKNWKYAGALLGGFILLALPWFIRSQQIRGNGYVGPLMMKNPYRPELGNMELGDWFTRIFNNVQRYITREIPNGNFSFITVNYKDPVVYSEWIWGILILIPIVFGIYKLANHRILVLGYLMGTFGILLLWPDAWFGIRFLVPVIPILTFLFAYGLYEAAKWLFSLVQIKNNSLVKNGLPFCFLFAITFFKPPITLLHNNVKGVYANQYKNYFEIAEWAKLNTPKDAIISCRKGNLFYLYSNRYIIGYMSTLDKEEQIEYLISEGVDYVVLEQLGYASTGRYLYPAIQRYPEKFKIVAHVKDPDTYLMEFKPELGYWGEYNEDEREGYGKYVWENGNKFEGEWKNNLRNGKGTMYFSNGEKMEANWVGDLLEGEATIWSADGVTHRKAIYKNNVMVQ